MIDFELQLNNEVVGFWKLLEGLIGPVGGLKVRYFDGENGVADYYCPNSEGWDNYLGRTPPSGILLQFVREGYLLKNSWVGYADFHPEFNVANLYWRLTGIGKHQMETHAR